MSGDELIKTLQTAARTAGLLEDEHKKLNLRVSIRVVVDGVEVRSLAGRLGEQVHQLRYILSWRMLQLSDDTLRDVVELAVHKVIKSAHH